MPSEEEIKQEIMTAVMAVDSSADTLSRVQNEVDFWCEKEDAFNKKIIQTFYGQWKRKKKVGSRNPWNSLTAQLLGITSQPPVGEFVFNKRRVFARPSPPDIDSDFEHRLRWMILEFLIAKYGRGRVGNIGTYQALKIKSALTRIVKVLDIANKFGSPDFTPENVKKVKEILDTLPVQYGAILKQKDENGKEHPINNCKDAYQWCKDFKFYMDRHPEIMGHANYIEGLLSVFSVHASGVVISDIPLDEIAPLRTAKSDGEIVFATQFVGEELEILGLIKFDILAISTLTVISLCMKMIKENYGIDIDIENLPLEDKKTLELYGSGNLTGVFQCEEAKMQDWFRQVGADRFDDVMAIISLYRPGPMDSLPEYCDRKHGRKPITYFHPSIEPHVKEVLSTTYGVLTYQEQVMRLCESLGDMSLTEALIVIKGISKKKADIVNKGKNKFIAGAQRRGVSKDIAEQYWEKFITPFAGYGFNASHACAYAYLSWETAYLKANFPEEFMCAYLCVEMERRKYEKIATLEREAARMGIFLLARDINKCEEAYTIVRKQDESAGIPRSEMRPSIHCKGLSKEAAKNIVQCRPYASIRDVAMKTDMSLVDSSSLAALCDMGFFRTKKEKAVQEFDIIRNDRKEARRRGRDSSSEISFD